MSSVHYKFKATLEYKTLTFDGLHIGVDELKKAICDKENIRTESFDLLLTNAHTKREYAAGELVPRNSSVVVHRVPRENAQKLPKVQDTSTSGMVQRGITTQQQNSYINPDEFAKMSEEQKLAHIKQVSTEKYSAANYQKRPTRIMEGPPPPTYICNRCAQPGHWYNNCPLVNTRKTTGIPMDELMETTQDDPNAMLHPSGRFVKPIMHHQARLQRKHEPFPGQPDDGSGSPYDFGGDEDILVPEQFKCNLCKGLLRDAVLAACCGHSFCAECYQQKLLANPTDCCPGPECSQQISADSLIPNKSLRSAIQKYMNEIRNGVEPAQTNEQSIGVNKPNVLTDTQSLLHKLMPDLAYAQAKRELATAGRSPTTTITGASSTRTIVSSTTQMSTIVAQDNFPSISAPPQPQIAVPVFDPKKPPPPLIPPSQLGKSFSPVSSIFPTPFPSITNNVMTTSTTSALSPDEMSSVWENYLKRKDMESIAKKNAAFIAPGTSSTGNVHSSDRQLNGAQSHQKGPTSTFELEKNLVWENFLKREETELMAKKKMEAPGTSSSTMDVVSSSDRQLNGAQDKSAESDRKSQTSKRKKSKSGRRNRSSKHKKSSKKKEKRHQKDKEKKERRHEKKKKERRHEKKERRHEKKESRDEKGEKERKTKERKKKNGKKEKESIGKNEE